MKKILVTILLTTLSCVFTQAESFRHLGVEEGLCSRQALEIESDSAGFIWIYTNKGINRYDGNELRYYHLEDTINPKSQIHFSTTMTTDAHGNIWIARKNGKIFSYNPKVDAFEEKLDLHKTPNLSEKISINNFQTDVENEVWISTSEGLYTWDYKGPIRLAGLKDEEVACIWPWSHDSIYASTSRGLKLLMRKKDGTFSEQSIELPSPMHILSLYGAHGKLFIGTYASGLYLLDTATKKIRVANCLISKMPIRALEALDNENILISSDGGGIYLMNIEREEILNHYTAHEEDDYGLSANTVTDIHVLPDTRIFWVGTSSNGASYLDTSLINVQHLRHTTQNLQSLKNNHVNTIFQDCDGDFWYGTNDGVSLCRATTGQWTHFLGAVNNAPNVVLAIAQDAEGTIYAGGFGIGVYLIDKKTGITQKMSQRDGDGTSGVGSEHIYTICYDGTDVWMGGIEGQLTQYNPQTHTYTYHEADCVGDIKCGTDGNLIMAGCEGLAIWNKKDHTIDWRSDFGDIHLNTPIRCVIQAHDGQIWMGTEDKGLISYNPATQEAKAYTTKNSNIANSVTSILEDQETRIWFCTEEELYCLDTRSQSLVSANEFLDIKRGCYNETAATLATDGNLIFGTGEGLLIFRPAFHFGQQDSVRIILTDIHIYEQGEDAKLGKSYRKTNINELSQIVLNHRQRSFSISFSSIIHLANAQQIRYEYTLDGYENKWQHKSRIGTADYVNVKPGTYSFRIRAFDKYSGKFMGARSLDIIIKKPVWASWWAILLYILCCTGIAVCTWVLWKRKKREERIQDKIQSFVRIAHDIRTPISLIKAPLGEMEEDQNLSEENRHRLEIAHSNVDRLLSMTNELLDLQKVDMDNREIKVSTIDIGAYLNKKELEYRTFTAQKDIELRLEVSPDMPAVYSDYDKIDHIISNLWSNAIKYTRRGTVVIRTYPFKNKWVFEIKDTGIGIPAEAQKRLFKGYYRAENAINLEQSGFGIGLMATHRLVKMLHGTIRFESTEGEGTTFTVILPQCAKETNSRKITKKMETELSEPTKETEGNNPKDSRYTILLAEDDKDMRQYLVQSLSDSYKVIAAENGAQALDAVRKFYPDLIISDVMMQIMGGDELCRIIKSSVETSHIPVILLSARSEREYIIAGLESGANDYITKPFDLSVLRARIRNIIQSRKHLHEIVLNMKEQPADTDYASQLDKEFLDKVMAFIKEELTNTEFSINDLCRKLGMSRTSFYNKIKALTGQSPNDFIRIMRLNTAKEMLLTRKYNIGEVADMVGFNDPKYFSTCFKRHFGISPSKV